MSNSSINPVSDSQSQQENPRSESQTRQRKSHARIPNEVRKIPCQIPNHRVLEKPVTDHEGLHISTGD